MLLQLSTENETAEKLTSSQGRRRQAVRRLRSALGGIGLCGAERDARHKSMFFAEKAADGRIIDYQAAVGGNLQLAPRGEARAALATDYARLVEDGLLLEDAEPFEALVERCADIAERANRAG